MTIIGTVLRVKTEGVIVSLTEHPIPPASIRGKYFNIIRQSDGYAVGMVFCVKTLNTNAVFMRWTTVVPNPPVQIGDTVESISSG